MFVALDNIPRNLDFCPYNVLSARNFIGDVKDTANSFTGWDKCMGNTACKWIAIVGIIIASLVAIWILGAIFRCLFYGIGFLSSLCCLCATCCSCCASNKYEKRAANQNYNNSPYYGDGPPGPIEPPTYKSQPVIVHNHYNTPSDTGYRGFGQSDPNITIGYERRNPDGTTEITTEPPAPPTQAAAGSSRGGFFGSGGGYRPLNNTNTGYSGSQQQSHDNTIEMGTYPMGDTNASSAYSRENPFQTPFENPQREMTPAQRMNEYYNVDSTYSSNPPPYSQQK